MIVDCIYTGPDGRSRFATVELPVLARTTGEDGRPHLSGNQGGDGWGIAVGDAIKPWGEWHTCGYPMLSIVLEGEWEVEAGSGERRRLATGSLTVFLDATGQGHRSQVLSEGGCKVIGVRVGDATRALLEAQLPQ